MAKNYDDYGYEKSYRSSGSSIFKRILIVLMVLVAIILIFFLIKGCTKKKENKKEEVKFDYESVLLEAGKTYFGNNIDEAPNAPGECSVVELQSLINYNLVDPNKFGNCNVTTTYVRTCILDDGTRHYTPWLVCTEKNSETEYSDLVEGTTSQVIPNQTYTEFKFLPQVVKQGGERYGDVEELWQDEITYPSFKTLASTTYYRYRDKLFTWNLTKRTYYSRKGEQTKASNVNDYYTTSPASGYNKTSNKTTEAYKWYTTTSEKVYYSKNGAKMPSVTEPDGYPNRDPQGIDVTRYRTRTVTSTFKPTKYYVCATSASSPIYVYQPNTECGKGTNKSYNYQREIVYSCVDGSTSTDMVIQNIVPNANYNCKKYSAWSDVTEKKCTGASDVCQSVTLTFYYWYKLQGGVNTYYPSGANKASGEKVYYIEAPVKGAIKDKSTKTTAYKWYKESKTTTTKYTALPPSGYYLATKSNEYNWSDWSDWSTKNPKVSDGRSRTIEKRVKIKLQQNLGSEASGWESLTSSYLTENEMINLFKEKGYKIETLEDITNNGETKYELQLYIRNKKETN